MIKTKDQLVDTVKQVADLTTKMLKTVIGKEFPIKSLTVFSHSTEEFDHLSSLVESMGRFHNYNNGPRVELFEPIQADSNTIIHLRIRISDENRPQLGCNDFETNFEDFKNAYLDKHLENLKLVKRPEYDMIEISHPDFNVLAYVVS